MNERRAGTPGRTLGGWFFINVLQAIFTAAVSALWITLALFVSIFSSELPLVMARRLWGPHLIWGARTKVEMLPGAKLDPKGTYVFVMNHQSMLDVPVAFAMLPFNIRFIAKRILLFVPFIGFFIWRTKMVAVDRTNPQQAYRSIAKAARMVASGVCVIAFPEGTRNVGPVQRFKRGPFVLAQAAGVPVVPVAIEGSGRALPRGGFKVRPAHVKMRIGEPISTADVGSRPEEIDELRRRAESAVRELHRGLVGEDRAADLYSSSPDTAISAA